ncbi:DUF2179 domain-containing protein [Fulvivirgaceae bacterium BMA10]|uniref:UPF0316 protein QQ008_23575 n=1 Tax=Splendidivirga corallicola TaxID=3051826 RepID=A0ABT8KXQ7_9BACT|nr:DUF2179 domain-containing protein [Fulvivirgaceae bacterium BMA10]
METFFTEQLGIDTPIFSYVILPLLIFLARICDVSINTVRIIYVMSGKKFLSTFLGFFESLIWLLAIGQIFKHVDNIFSYIAYPAGFAAGIFVGMIIEEKLALGKVVMRIITRKNVNDFTAFLKENNFRYSVLQGNGKDGKENIIFTVLERENQPQVEKSIKELLPTAFYTVGGIKGANEAKILLEKPSRRGIGSWLSSIKRK